MFESMMLRVFSIFWYTEFGTSFVLTLCLLFQVRVKITLVFSEGNGFIAIGGEQF